MTSFSFFFFGAIGLIVGSFLNVVIYRYNTGRGVAMGRSQCLSCSAELRWFELVPLFSFLIQGGRCRRCVSRISWQYPVVELATGLLFVLGYFKFGLIWLLPVYLIILSLLVVITVYDLRHKIIPDGLVYVFIILALLIGRHLFTGLGLFLFFFLLWWLSRGHWMGFGDAKLALGVGFLLGLEGGVSAMAFAFWLGALIGVGLILFRQLLGRHSSFTIKSEVPFAPFIIVGLLLNLLFGLNVFNLF